DLRRVLRRVQLAQARGGQDRHSLRVLHPRLSLGRVDVGERRKVSRLNEHGRPSRHSSLSGLASVDLRGLRFGLSTGSKPTSVAAFSSETLTTTPVRLLRRRTITRPPWRSR